MAEIENKQVTAPPRKEEQMEFQFDDDMNPVQIDGEGLPTPKEADNKKPVEDELDIEIVDDTPDDDKGRQPLPDEIKQKLEGDINDASTKTEERIKQLRKAWHDERREKETYGRQLEEATRVSQLLMKERNEYRTQLSQGEAWALQQAKRASELELAQAKAEYRAAYDEGDSEKLAEAQSRLSRATAQFDETSKLSPRYTLQNEQQPVYNAPKAEPQRQKPIQVDQKTLEWGNKNKWYGDAKEPEMNSLALGVHQRLISEGVPPGSDEYFEQIDARMREVFPSKFDDVKQPDRETPPKTPEKQRSPTVVAPVERTPTGKRKVVLTKSQVAIAKKLGITNAMYAQELIKQQEG